MSFTNNNLIVRRKSMATEDNNKITVQQLQPNESSQPRSVPEPNSLPKQALPLNFLYESRVFL